jgi:hypothetical protein
METSPSSLMDADAIVRELLHESAHSDTPSVETTDDDVIRKLLQASLSGGPHSNSPIDIEQLKQLKAMLGGMLRQSGAPAKPSNARDALRLKLQQKQRGRLTKHATNARAEKRNKSAPKSEDGPSSVTDIPPAST